MSKSGRFSKELYPILRKKTEVLGLMNSGSEESTGVRKLHHQRTQQAEKPGVERRPGSCSFLSQSRQDRDRALVRVTQLSKDKVPSSLQYYSQFSIVHKSTPAYTIVPEHAQRPQSLDERAMLLPDSSQQEPKGVEFKKQLPRPPLADPKRVNEHRFATLNLTPAISTKCRRVQTPSFSKQRNRPKLFVNCPSLLLSYSPKFSQVELDLGKNGLDMMRAAARQPLILKHVHDLQYTRPQSADKHVNVVQLKKSASRPSLTDSELPLYMCKVPSRLGVTCYLDKSLRMNASLASDYQSDEEELTS